MMAPEVSEKRSTTRAPERLTRSVMEGLSGRKNFANHDFADRQGLAPRSLVRQLSGAESPAPLSVADCGFFEAVKRSEKPPSLS